jgi:hypothetical protein
MKLAAQFPKVLSPRDSIADGKDQTDHGPLLNQEISFEPINRETIMATITYEKRLGVQFKCFVDQGPYEYEKIEQLLKKAVRPGTFEFTSGAPAINRVSMPSVTSLYARSAKIVSRHSRRNQQHLV